MSKQIKELTAAISFDADPNNPDFMSIKKSDIGGLAKKCGGSMHKSVERGGNYSITYIFMIEDHLRSFANKMHSKYPSTQIEINGIDWVPPDKDVEFIHMTSVSEYIDDYSGPRSHKYTDLSERNPLRSHDFKIAPRGVGITMMNLLEASIVHIKILQTMLPCQENFHILHHLEMAMKHEKDRDNARNAQDLKGTMRTHNAP